MKIKIGENIKRLRRERNITQEKLAEVLNVSCAAVSKWETGDTYPDITLLFPLSHYFKVSLDELMGYDASSIENNINSILIEYVNLQNNDNYILAKNLIIDARKKYPQDYRIMHRYIFEIAGGFADNDANLLMENAEELGNLCDIILAGCTDEKIRIDAITMKAKILNSKGETKKALELLNTFPSFYHSSGQRIEQLYAKNTDDFYNQLMINMYELAEFTANKLGKSIAYDRNLSINEKLSKADKIGDALDIYAANFEIFTLMLRAFWGEIFSKVVVCNLDDANIIKYCEKIYESTFAVDQLVKLNKYIRSYILEAYDTNKLIILTINGTEKRISKSVISNQDYIKLKNKYL